jgi:hypothetical protein
MYGRYLHVSLAQLHDRKIPLNEKVRMGSYSRARGQAQRSKGAGVEKICWLHPNYIYGFPSGQW